MKVDLSFKINKLDGTDYMDLVPDGVDGDGKPKFKDSGKLTLRKAIVDSLTANFDDEKNLDPKKKAERGWLAMKIYDHKDPIIDLNVDDVSLCMKLIGKRYNPLIVAKAWEVLDPSSKKDQ